MSDEIRCGEGRREGECAVASVEVGGLVWRDPEGYKETMRGIVNSRPTPLSFEAS